MHRVIAMQNRVGIQSQVVTADELFELQPFTNVGDIAIAAYERDSGYVDSIAATRGMAEAALRGGAGVIEGRAVTALRTTNGRVTGVETSDGPIDAGAVVCAAGAWSVPLLAGIGVDVPVEAQRVQVAILTRPLAMPTEGTMTYVDTAAGFFCRNWGPNRTLAGVGGGEFHDIVDPDRYDERLDPGFGDTVINYIQRRMPPMAQATTLYGHAGIYDMTPDTHPILSGVDGLDGLYLMLGFSGAGFKKGPAIGQCMAEMIVHGASSTVDLAPFRLTRFSDGTWQEPWSPDEYSFSTDFGHKF
jgi:glycine/D-amino acid oxidase-like deaminating enzyme